MMLKNNSITKNDNRGIQCSKLHKNTSIKYKDLYIILFLILFLSLIIYFPFIFKNYYFIFEDIASDTSKQFIPGYKSISNSIKESGFSFWSFEHGLGQSIYTAQPDSYVDPFNLVLYFFDFCGIDIVNGVVYIQIIKLLIAGTICFFYFRKMNYTSLTIIVMSLLYCFTGDFIIRSEWYQHSHDTILYILLLLCAELFIQDNKIYPLSILGFCVGILRPIFYPYIFGIILFGYITVRIIYLNRFQIKSYFFQTSKLTFLYLLGIGISSFYFIPVMAALMNSTRSGILQVSILDTIFSIQDPEAIFSGFFLLFSPWALGTGSGYLGYINILDSPVFYCGVISIFLNLYLIIDETDRKRRNIYLFILLLCTGYLVSPFIQGIFNGPTRGMYYKISSPAIPVLLLYVAANSFEKLQKKINIKKMLFTFCSIIIAIVIEILFNMNFVQNIAKKALIFSIAFLMIYIFLLIVRPKSHKIVNVLLIIFTLAELFVSNKGVLNLKDRTVLSSDDKDKGEYYWDGTIEAVEYLKNIDDSFYRIQKTYDNNFLTNSQFQNYYGVNNYDSFLSREIGNLNSLLGTTNVPSHITNIPYTNQNINNILSVKYLLDKNNTYIPDNYKYITTVNDIKIYENTRFMPFGIVYDKDNAMSYNKDLCILITSNNMTSYYISNDAESRNFNYNENFLQISGSNNIIKDDSYIDRFAYTSVTEDPSIIFEINSSRQCCITFEGENLNDKDDIGQIFWKSADDTEFSQENSIYFSMPIGEKEYHIDIDSNKEFQEIRIDFGTIKNGKYSIRNVYSILEDTEALDLIFLREMLNEPFNISYFSDDNIIGEITLSEAQMLFFSIPYDKGWHIKDNGVEVIPENINIAFTGINLDKGQHTIELYYIPPGLVIGSTVSIASIIILIAVVLLNKKIYREKL